MTPDDIATFNDSLVRCLRGGDFLERFYRLFLASSPEVAAKFAGTDFDRQKRMLRYSLYMMVMAAEGEDEAMEYLQRIAREHGRDGLGVTSEMYDQWLECLLESAAEHDPEWSEETERVWRTIMGGGIELMRSQA